MGQEEAIQPGTILAGRYQVRRELGRGGMGCVYLCRDLVLDERVALKVLSRPGSTVRPEDSWWFQEEARALASLSHPAIVRARDFGTLVDGTPYLAMDAVPGRSLHEWIYLAQTEGVLPWHVVWTLVDQVLGALAHAHARGVIHGDLKPSNVLLDLPPEGGGDIQVHVLDLGLAWLLQDRVDHRLDGTQAAEPTVRWGAGTPGWMAPEQIRFATPHIGGPTDLYALGCILFALLSNREPYTGSNEELLQQHRSAPIPTPDIPPGTPAEAGDFVRRLLAKRPWHRFDLAGDARRVWRTLRPAESQPRAVVTYGSDGPVSVAPTREEITLPEPFGPTEVGTPSVAATGLLGLRPSPFVGRLQERQRLLDRATEVYESHQRGTPLRRLVLLTGEAGVGKSRLADWLCEEVHERAMLIPLRARYRQIAAPLDGVVGAVIQHYRLEKSDRDVVEKVLMNLWGVTPEDDDGTTWVAATAEWLRPAPPGSTSPGPTGKRFAFDHPELRWLVIRRTLERIAAKRPILLWMDDLHLASDHTFEGLSRIFAESRTLSVLAIATVRSEGLEADVEAAKRLEQAILEAGGETLEIKPFDAPATHALLRETLPLDEAAVIEAATRSKGNPLFALQTLHAWAMGGHLELKDGKYSVPRASLAARAATTSELWEGRLAALPEDLRPAALAAAALGGDIRREVLHAELDALGVDSSAAIGAMKRAQILLSSGSDRLRWPHALLQEHLLTQLFLRADASRIFRAAADALAEHPAAGSRRLVRHRVVNLVRAGDFEAAADLLHDFVRSHWSRSRDPAAVLRDLALLDDKLEGVRLARHKRWYAEALRHAGRLEEARRIAEEARQIFQDEEDLREEAACLRLLGHIASDLAAPALGRRLVARGLAMYEEVGDEHGAALCQLVIGEIDFLLGEHARAKAILTESAQRFAERGDRLAHAQTLLLQCLIDQAGGSPGAAREMLNTAREEFDSLGYRLGMAQCDVGLAHAEHREGRLAEARETALLARQSFRDLSNPRGEAACERLLAMAALDAGDPASSAAHAEAAGRLFDQLSDPWGQVETRLILAQIALDRGDDETARAELIACEAVALIEAEPKQHRHLTRAWLAYHEGRFHDAAREIDTARGAFKDANRTGDHTPHLLSRFAAMSWPKPASTRIDAWIRAIEQAHRTHADSA